jgi:hypothetical protein
MVWPYGELPHEVNPESLPSLPSSFSESLSHPPNEIRDILLDRIMHSSPAKSQNGSSSPQIPIRRRRRFDSEPAVSTRSQAQEPIIYPQSPQSPDSGLDVFEEDQNDLAISLDGVLMENNQIADFQAFKNNMITFEQFNEDPKKYISNPDLILRMGNKYYNWHSASAIFMSLIVFNKPIEEDKIQSLQNETVFRRKSWFSWGRNRTVSYNEQPSGEIPSFRQELNKVSFNEPIKSALVPPKTVESKKFRRTMSVPPASYENLVETVSTESINLKKTLMLEDADLKKLPLKYGENEICFWVTTMFQGNSYDLNFCEKIKAYFHKWNYCFYYFFLKFSHGS